MSLDTLLEAAEYIEWSAHSKPRDDGSPKGEIMTFIKTETVVDEEGDSSFDDISESQRGYEEESKEKRRAGGAGTRETHNKLEKNRRAHLKECFDLLKDQVPFIEDKKTSNLSILRGALKFIQTLRKKEKDLEKDLHRLSTEKNKLRERVARLKTDLAKMNMDVDLTKWMPSQEQETNSISTASGAGSPIISDPEDEKGKRGKKTKNHIKEKLQPKQVPLVKNIPVKILQPANILTPITTFTSTAMTTTPTMATHIRAPVTQLLHQTLSKRQALQKQREQLAVSQASSTTVPTVPHHSTPLVMNELLRQQLSFPVMNNPMAVTKLLPSTINITTPSTSKTFKSHQSQPKMNAPTGYTSTPSVSNLKTPIPSSSTAINQISTLTALSQLTAVAGMGGPSLVSTATPISVGSTTTNKITQINTTMVSPAVTSLASMSAIKPIMATAQSHQLVSLNPIVTQFARPSNVFTGITTQTPTSATQPQIVSFAHMGNMTPLTVVPQGIPVASLSAAQFNNIMTPQHILKQIPILQQPILQQMQQSQVIGQPMVKQVVMVSLPNVVSSTASTLPINITTSS